MRIYASEGAISEDANSRQRSFPASTRVIYGAVIRKFRENSPTISRWRKIAVGTQGWRDEVDRESGARTRRRDRYTFVSSLCAREYRDERRARYILGSPSLPHCECNRNAVPVSGADSKKWRSRPRMRYERATINTSSPGKCPSSVSRKSNLR